MLSMSKKTLAAARNSHSEQPIYKKEFGKTSKRDDEKNRDPNTNTEVFAPESNGYTCCDELEWENYEVDC
ncbi:hypothetical protein HYALB_00004550 [Hymenoscyphus albidus]|uniref:Uncharacterized protein n=1 Tax=Hymenoscyphus albidus TaxID=595503 RepID=A0A9N9M2V9_9HELO|nr:hypothetical protein HYALB_00004550 [Hymenoscyphus albidus]